MVLLGKGYYYFAFCCGLAPDNYHQRIVLFLSEFKFLFFSKFLGIVIFVCIGFKDALSWFC